MATDTQRDAHRNNRETHFLMPREEHAKDGRSPVLAEVWAASNAAAETPAALSEALWQQLPRRAV